MNKEKIGKGFYVGSLIIALLVILFGRTLLGPKENYTEELYIRYSNLIQFAVFGFILPIGVIVREFYLLPYKKNLMIIKIIILFAVALIGTTLFFLIPTIAISSIILYIAYGSLIFILIPSNSFRKLDE